MNTKSASFVFGSLFFLISPLPCLSSCQSVGHRVGGPCSYNEYSGQAEILSVEKIIQQEGVTTSQSEKYEVKFKFQTDQIITEEFVRIKGREFLWELQDGSYPDGEFIGRNDIRVGKTFPCVMRVITSGTCTPVLFEFPTIGR